jgi:hypothetical protein
MAARMLRGLALVGGAAISALLLWGCGGDSDELQIAFTHGSVPLTGRTYSDAQTYLTNSGEDAVTLRSASLVGSDTGLKIVGARVIPDRGRYHGSFVGSAYLPKQLGGLPQLSGYKLPGKARNVEILIGLRPTRSGEHRYGVRITYEGSDGTGEVASSVLFNACTGPSGHLYSRDCPTPPLG